jgi:hypothetical protein
MIKPQRCSWCDEPFFDSAALREHESECSMRTLSRSEVERSDLQFMESVGIIDIPNEDV